MALSTIMGTSYACLGAVRNLENVGKRMGADLLLNFRELRKAEVEHPRIPLPRTPVNRRARGRAEAALRPDPRDAASTVPAYFAPESRTKPTLTRSPTPRSQCTPAVQSGQ